MTASPDTKTKIATELARVEEDCTYSAKAHFNAADRWRTYNNALGIPSVALSAIAGTAFFQEQPEWGGVLALAAGLLTGLITFLKPSERAAGHKGAGDQYKALQNDSRVFREIKLHHACDDDAAVSGMEEFSKRRNELNAASNNQPSRRDFEKARQGIEEGEATHRVDQRS